MWVRIVWSKDEHHYYPDYENNIGKTITALCGKVVMLSIVHEAYKRPQKKHRCSICEDKKPKVTNGWGYENS